MIKLDGKYQTRDGKAVRIYTIDSGKTLPVHGAIDFGRDDWHVFSWTTEGAVSALLHNEDLDLVLVPIEHEVLTNDSSVVKLSETDFNHIVNHKAEPTPALVDLFRHKSEQLYEWAFLLSDEAWRVSAELMTESRAERYTTINNFEGKRRLRRFPDSDTE